MPHTPSNSTFFRIYTWGEQRKTLSLAQFAVNTLTRHMTTWLKVETHCERPHILASGIMLSHSLDSQGETSGYFIIVCLAQHPLALDSENATSVIPLSSFNITTLPGGVAKTLNCTLNRPPCHIQYLQFRNWLLSRHFNGRRLKR